MKGTIIWILHNNCLYCSEIKEESVREPDKHHTVLYLDPIIGDINMILIKNCNKALLSFDAIYSICFKENHFLYFDALISFDLDKLCMHMN